MDMIPTIELLQVFEKQEKEKSSLSNFFPWGRRDE